MKYKQSVYKTFALISQLGISILVPILLCTFFGTWLEKKVSFPVFIPLVIVGVNPAKIRGHAISPLFTRAHCMGTCETCE